MNLYCLKHAREFVVLDENHGHICLELLPQRVLFCFGPWTFCPPPELPLGWEKTVEPPTSDEMELIDQNATELALDLELA